MITILDYGINNLRSVTNALLLLREPFEVCTELTDAERLLIPGVGAFSSAMHRLQPNISRIQEFAAHGVPILGICLGQQLLFESSEEHGECEGLGLLKGRVRYLPSAGVKVPHMGWNQVDVVRDCPLTRDAGTPPHFAYFVHSLYADCKNSDDVVAQCEHGIRFPAIVSHGNVFGCQFHPEKSDKFGLSILKAFANLGAATAC